MSQEPRIWYNDKNHAVATCGPLIVVSWRGAKTYANWRAESTPLFSHIDKMSPAGCCVLIIAEENASHPDADARREVDELARERSGRVVASAVIASGSTMRVTAVRTLVIAINVFGKSTMRVFTDAPGAVGYLADTAKRAKVLIDVPKALQVVGSMRTVQEPARSEVSR